MADIVTVRFRGWDMPVADYIKMREAEIRDLERSLLGFWGPTWGESRRKVLRMIRYRKRDLAPLYGDGE
jgi:hypothetical protein